MRDLKTAVVTLLLAASLAAGCTGNSPEEDLDAKYQEGYDAGYGDAYDASYDGVAQHQYNEGWDDGWGVANTDSQAEIAEIQATVSGLEAATQVLQLQSDLVVQQDLLAEWINRGINNDFSYVNLSFADLRSADLRYADLGAANLTNADLINANLYLANLQGAQLHLVSWDNTVCPDGTNSDDNGNTCEDNL